MKTSTLVGCIAIGSCLLLREPTVRAEESAEGRADQLFEEAVRLMRADHCQDAIPRFIESDRIDANTATLVNLGTCYARLGKTGSAFRTYRQAAERAVLEGNDALRSQADKAIAILEPKLTKLRIVTPAGGDRFLIRVNGQPVGDELSPVPLDPGENVVEAVAPGREPWRRTVNADGQSTIIMVEVPDLTPKPTSSSTAPTQPPTRGHEKDLRLVAGVVGGAGVIGLVTGAVMALNAKASWNEASEHCLDQRCNEVGVDLREQALDRAAVATWATLLGTAAVGTAVGIWLLYPGRAESPPPVGQPQVARPPLTTPRGQNVLQENPGHASSAGLRIGPWAQPHGLGLVVEGRL